MSEAAGERPSKYPRLEALGWENDEPTKLIEKGLAKLDEASTNTEEAIRKASIAARAQAKRNAATAKKVSAK